MENINVAIESKLYSISDNAMFLRSNSMPKNITHIYNCLNEFSHYELSDPLETQLTDQIFSFDETD